MQREKRLIPQMLCMELPYGEAIALLHTHAREMQTHPLKSCVQMFTAAFFMILKIWRQPKFPTTIFVLHQTKQCSHTMEYYSAMQKE